MNTFLDFLKRYSYWFVFLLLEAVSLTLVFRFNHYQQWAWFSAANSASARVNGVFTSVASFLQMGSVNTALTARNVELERENAGLRHALEQKTQQDSATIARIMGDEGVGSRLISATVVGNSNSSVNNFLILNRGSNDGVQPEMGVMGGSGVVGIVYLTSENYALVMPLTNTKSSISCRVRGQNYFGSLQWSGDDFANAYLDDIPRYAEVKRGEAVETSGYSAVFPPGLFVGTVTSIENSADGQSYRLGVKLGTNFMNIRDVVVIETPYKAELDTLQAHGARMDAAETAATAKQR